MNSAYQVATFEGHTYYRWVEDTYNTGYTDEVIAQFETEEEAARFVETHYKFFEWEHNHRDVEFAPEIEELLGRKEFRGRIARIDALVAVYSGMTGDEAPFVELLTTIEEIIEGAGYYYSPRQDEKYMELLTELHDVSRDVGM